MNNLLMRFLLTFMCVVLISCGGGGGGGGSSGGGSSSESVSLTLSATGSYPAGSSSAITAYLTIINTSNADANGLTFSVPSATNTTGVAITVASGSSNPCQNIAAHTPCTFPVTIAAGANPGSFKVIAVSPSTGSTISGRGTFASKARNFFNQAKSMVGISAGTFELDGNIGLVDVAPNTGSGAAGIKVLYANILQSSDNNLPTPVTITAYVNSPNAGTFNTINLTTSGGTALDFSPASPNSGTGKTNLIPGQIVTLNLLIPAGVPSYTFYIQTMLDGAVVSQGGAGYMITLNSASAQTGILTVQPSAFILESTYESQVLTYVNTGNGTITGLSIAPAAPLTAGTNTCGSTLAAGSSCSYKVSFTASQSGSGNSSVTASYNNGQSATSTVAQVVYVGSDDSESGLVITSSTDFSFATSTGASSESAQITIYNSGNSSESQISFTVPTYFALTPGVSNTCTMTSSTTISNTLASNTSCKLTLTYTNPNATPQASANLVANYTYGYNGQTASTTVAMTYSTAQSSSALEISPNPKIFSTISSNTGESATQVFTVTNNGLIPATAVTVPVITGTNASLFTVTNQTCSSIIAAGGTCSITVRFGPAASGTESSVSKTATLSMGYLPYPSAPNMVGASSFLSGTVALPNSPNIVATFTTSGFAQGSGPGNIESAYQVESGNAAYIEVTYTNSGGGAATSFNLAGQPASWQRVSPSNPALDCTSSVSTLESAGSTTGSKSCLARYQLPGTTASGPRNFTYSSITVSYTGFTGIISPTSGTTAGTTYATVYAPAQVFANLSNESDGSPVISNISSNQLFYVSYGLTGGYNVSQTNYVTGITGGNGTMSFTGGNSCGLSSTKSQCAVQLNSGVGTSGTTTYTITTSGSAITVTNNPSTLLITMTPTYAQISLESVVLSPVESAGNGSKASPFYVESQTANQTMTLTYVNSGNGNASNFTVAYSPSVTGYTISPAGNNKCNNVTLESGSTGIESTSICTVKFSVATTTVGAESLTLTSLKASWTDESGAHSNQQINWHNSVAGVTESVVSLNIFRRASVNTCVSRSSSSCIAIESTISESTFYLYYSFTGGYPGQVFSYTANISSGPSIIGGNSCVFNATGSLSALMCYLQVSSGTSVGDKAISFGTSSNGVSPSPAIESILVYNNPVIRYTYTKDGIESHPLLPNESFAAGHLPYSFRVTARLESGGLNIPAVTIESLSLTPASESILFANATNSLVESCAVSTASPSCSINVMVGNTTTPESYILTMGNSAGYAESKESISFIVESPEIIFVTAETHNGDFSNSLNQVDAMCTNAANKPDNRTYKAMFAGLGRVACTTNNCAGGGNTEHTDWVLRSDTTYYNVAESPIFTTNVNAIFDLGSSYATNSIASLSSFAWTGLTMGWVTSADSCLAWSNNTSAYGLVGSATSINNWMIEYSALNCGNLYRIYCVSQ